MLVLRDLLTKQITRLNIDIIKPAEYCSEIVRNIFELILSLCKKLTVLHFCDMFITRKCLTTVLFLPSGSNICSTLIKLKIKVANLIDCICLLDGRLESLSTLIISAQQIYDPLVGEEVSIIFQ
jgi:hypothetical protein